jgi:hypothetical protein
MQTICTTSQKYLRTAIIVLLPGFQRGGDIKASQGKGQRSVLAKKTGKKGKT